jgi:hypothetical protein
LKDLAAGKLRPCSGVYLDPWFLSLLNDLHMKPKKLNPKLLWMQFEDVLAPRLGLSVKERPSIPICCAIPSW